MDHIKDTSSKVSAIRYLKHISHTREMCSGESDKYVKHLM
jgi:hypothetical protein